MALAGHGTVVLGEPAPSHLHSRATTAQANTGKLPWTAGQGESRAGGSADHTAGAGTPGSS